LKRLLAALVLMTISCSFALADNKTAAPTPSPTPAPTATPVAPTLKVEADNYTVPVYFEPKPNGVNVLDQALEYELNGNNLSIGKLQFNSTTIKYDLEKSKTVEGDYSIKFSWPKAFLTQGKLLMRTNVEKKTMFSLDTLPPGTIDGDTYTIESHISAKDVAAWDKQTPLKFCVTNDADKKSFCSQDYIIKDVYEDVKLRVSRQEYKSEVVLNNESQKNKGKYLVKYGTSLVGKIVFKNGAEFDFETAPVPFESLDIVETAEHKVLFKAKGGVPIGGDNKSEAESWIVRLDKNNPYLYLNTKNDVMLRQDFEFTKPLPTEKMRPRLKTGSRDSTYWTHVPLHGYEAEKAKVSSQEFSAEMTGDNSFNWEFQASTKGDVNRSHIKIQEDNQDYLGYYEIYKGYPFELSGRFTGAFSGNGALILGEVLGTAWLEQFFGSENTVFSLQHWGVAARYLTSLSAPTDTNGLNETLTSINANIKYRFTPGIWNQDESFGLMLAYQNLNFESAPVSMGGIGAFWVRPMPSLVDRLFNKVKWFRYPKVIDVEVEYFPMSLTSGTTVGTNFNAIVHGKLFVKPSFFIEGAVGMKQYNYNQANAFQAQITTLFGSGGVGWDF
jgi:hypothetical protein